MKSITAFLCCLIVFAVPGSAQKQIKSEKALAQTSLNIRKAFAEADIETIKLYHHPEVIKALAADKLLQGRDAVLDDLKGTLQAFKLEFMENNVESLLIKGNVAIEQTQFSIRGTPKNGGELFVFKGRTMVIYVRYAQSPTGWASIREIIQPAK
jgi:ketosteroid isomerase-like protein